MAACNIEAGVDIKLLCCNICAAYVGLFEGGDGQLHLREPSEAELAAFYRPLCRVLHGLESLDVSFSIWCSEQTIAEVVAAAPDLRALAVRENVVDEPLVRRAIGCGSLTAVTVHSSFERVDEAEQLTLEVDLEESSGLKTCVVKVQGVLVVGDKVAVTLECYEGADIKTHACSSGWRKWELNCNVSHPAELHAPPGVTPVSRQATLSFQWGQDEAWASEVYCE
jgi:hypothetical protein